MNKSSPHAAILVLGLLLTSWSPPGFAAGCRNSPVLFAYRGSLFTVSLGQKPMEIASGFKAPGNITWAPGCAHYAFIDSGSLWVGSPNRPPQKVDVPGNVSKETETGFPSYRWSPDGREVAVMSRPPACSQPPRAAESPGLGNTYWAALPELLPRLLTNDCKANVLGWSQSARCVLVYRNVYRPCSVTVPVCATGDVVALDPYSRSRTTLMKATYLRQKKLDEPEFARWNEAEGTLYIWSAIMPMGPLGALVAMRVPSGRILWSVDCYEATVLSNDKIAIQVRRTEDYEKSGLNFSWQFEIVKNGKITGQYVRLPTMGNRGIISADGKYIEWDQPWQWDHPNSSRKIFTLYFATRTDAKSWKYVLPEGFEPASEEWMPSGSLALVVYQRAEDGTLSLGLWQLNPRTRTGAKLFEASRPLEPKDIPYTAASQSMPLAYWSR